MKTLEVEVLGEASNAAVIKLPYRQFPGVVIQGDSLSIMRNLADRIDENLASGDMKKVRAEMRRLREILAGYQEEYEHAVEAAGLSLPYVRRR